MNASHGLEGLDPARAPASSVAPRRAPARAPGCCTRSSDLLRDDRARPRREQGPVGRDHRVRQPARADPVLPRRPRGRACRARGTRRRARCPAGAARTIRRSWPPGAAGPTSRRRRAVAAPPGAELARRRPGRARSPPPSAGRPVGDPASRASTKRYPGGVLALDGLTMDGARRARCSGSWARTAPARRRRLRLLAGLTRPTAGRAIVGGTSWSRTIRSPSAAASATSSRTRGPTAG